MFKKVLQSISKSLGGKEEPKPGAWVSARTKTSEKALSLLDKLSATLGSSASRGAPHPVSPARAGLPKSPEDLCGIGPKMPKEEIKARLAMLYRRYNRATSSLDAKLRAEAETMLDAIVAVREKTFGPI
jgi:hypothetical protein